MSAYMRHQFEYFGITLPGQRLVAKAALAGVGKPTEADLRALATACWSRTQREYRYVACDYLRRHVRVCGPGFLPFVGELIGDRPWWDVVDTLASHVVGPLVKSHPTLVATMDEWLAGEDMWLTRTAILHQLGYKQDTNVELLFRYCLARADHRDFFIRKAIGWALRQYAWTDPDTVRTFVLANEARLAPLSVREALKNIGRAATETG
jgi:3-methyladenine DNA glycosylase AlkD